jgi:signal transduction histidine kinase/ligand-binding sensor domain-containing protein
VCIHKFIIIAAFISLPFEPVAQFSNIRFKHLTTADGLPDIYVTCTFQDSRGFIWFGTREGLARYDGVQMVKYFHSATDTNSLTSNTILSIEEDRQGNIWLGTQKGINILKKQDGKIKRYADALEKAGKTWLCNIAEDIFCSPDGRVWVGTAGGLFYYDAANDLFKSALQKKATPSNEEPALIYKHCITSDASGRLYVFMGNCIYVSENNGSSFDTLQGFKPVVYPVNEITPSFLLYDNGNILYAYQQWPELKLFNLENKTTSTIKFFQQTTIHPPPVQIWHAARVNAEELWIAALGDDNNKDFGGVFVLGNDYKIKYQLLADRADPNTISMPWVLQVYKDKQGTVWLPTLETVDYYHPSFSSFKVYNQFNKNIKEVYACPALCRDKNDKIWCGSWDNGIAKLDPVTGEVKKFCVPLPLSANNNLNRIHLLAAGKDDMLWVLTAGGLIWFDIKKEAYIRNGSAIKIFNKPVDRIINDSLLNIWLLANDTIWKIDNNTRHLSAVYPDTKNPLSEKSIENCWPSPNGKTIWVLTNEPRRLIHFDVTVQQKLVYEFPALNNNIWWINNSGDSLLYLATDRNGFYIYHTKNKTTETYNINNGLPSNQVKAMVKDFEGKIWLGTMRGISRFDPETKSIRNFFSDDGLETESVIHSFTKTTDGTIFFPTIKNVVSVNPERLLPPKNSNQPCFIRVKTGEQEKNISDWAAPLRLQANENSFSIEYTSMNFISPVNDEFQYSLTGYDNDWINAGNRRFINYTNLPGGSYTFRLRTRNRTQEWSEPAELKIHVKEVFYKTGWFTALLAGFILFILFAFYRMKLMRILAIEKMRQRFSRDLHDDIGSTLSSINILAKTADKENTSSETLNKIQHRSQKMLDAMDDIIWSTKPDNDALESLIIRTREYAGEVLEAAGIHYEIFVQNSMPPIKLNMEQKKNLYLIFKEAINNLAKYSKSKTASIRFLYSHNRLQLLIKDDGIGFDPKETRKGNGLQNMQSRANEMHAELDLESEPGKGTAIRVGLPL